VVALGEKKKRKQFGELESNGTVTVKKVKFNTLKSEKKIVQKVVNISKTLVILRLYFKCIVCNVTILDKWLC
jgi:hypothetical protein